MLVGIKYCGGCRASFDRKAEAERIAAAYGSEDAERQGPAFAQFVQAKAGERYDALLVLCGCRSRCPDIGAYDFGRAVYIDEKEGEGWRILKNCTAAGS